MSQPFFTTKKVLRDCTKEYPASMADVTYSFHYTDAYPVKLNINDQHFKLHDLKELAKDLKRIIKHLEVADKL